MLAESRPDGFAKSLSLPRSRKRHARQSKASGRAAAESECPPPGLERGLGSRRCMDDEGPTEAGPSAVPTENYADAGCTLGLAVFKKGAELGWD